jgi:hypothetical protein
VDISRERCERLAHNLRGDWYEATADLITALRAALDRAEADAREAALQYLSDTGQLMDRIAAMEADKAAAVEALIEAAAFTWQGLVGEYGYQKARVNFGRLEDALDALARLGAL